MKQYFLVLILFISVGICSSQIPKKVSKSVLLMNGTAHIGNGKVIKNSAIGIRNGKIDLVANSLLTTIDVTKYDTVILVNGKHVYPGFIAPNSTLGLQEIGAVRATKDYRETGEYNPNVRSLIAFNTDSKIIPTVRTNGVLIAQITPRGGIISGTSSIMHLEGWNWEDAVLKKEDGIHLNWPEIFFNFWWSSEPSKKNKNYNKTTENIEQFFKEAKAYSNQDFHEEIDLKFEAMRKIFSGNGTLYIHVNKVKEIMDALNFAKSLQLTKVVLVGATEAVLVADILKERKVGVMLKRVHSLPHYTDSDIDEPYKAAAKLNEAGVLFCFQNSGDMEQMGTRNLPFYAGTAVAYGLEYEKAIEALTLNAAKLLGIDNRVGTLEPKKDATLFVSEGDALDMKTNNVILAYIAGKKLDLTNNQYLLYKKYTDKYSKSK